MTWTTPVSRLDDWGMVSAGNNDWGGTYELICGPRRAHEFLNGGMTKVNGQPCRVSVVCEWPEINGIHLQITVPSEARFEDRPIP